MRIRSRANGNVIDVDDVQGRFLVEKGIYETLAALPEPSAEPPVEPKPKPQRKPKRKYRRRDVTAEE